MPRYLAFAGLALFSLLSACNTMQGLGRDVSAGGNQLSETANEVEEEI